MYKTNDFAQRNEIIFEAYFSFNILQPRNNFLLNNTEPKCNIFFK